MKLPDRIWLTCRHLKSSLVGSVLVVLAIAIGVALAASTAAFISKYNAQTQEMLNHPVYREVLVEALGNPKLESELPLPVVELEGAGLMAGQLDIRDLPLVLQSVPNLVYAYLAEGAVFKSTSYLAEEYAAELSKKAMAVEKGERSRENAEDEAPEKVDNEKEEDEISKEEFQKIMKEKNLGEDELTAIPAERNKAEQETSVEDKKKLKAEQEKVDNWLKDLEKKVTALPLAEFTGIYTSPDFFSAYGLSAASGSLFGAEDLAAGNLVMVLGSELAAVIFPDGNAIGAGISVNRQTYTVLGVLEPTGLVEPGTSASLNEFAFVPHYIYAGLAYGKQMKKGSLSTLRFAVDDSGKIEQAVKGLREYINAEYPRANLRVRGAVDKLKSDRQKSVRILTVLIFLSAASLLIASINMFNLLLIRVIKNTKGIGILRALGFSRNNVLQQFLSESFIMSLTGTVVGLVFSPLIFRFLQQSLLSGIGAGQSAIFRDLLLGTGLAFVFSLVFGLYPALVARQTDTALALRSE